MGDLSVPDRKVVALELEELVHVGQRGWEMSRIVSETVSWNGCGGVSLYPPRHAALTLRDIVCLLECDHVWLCVAICKTDGTGPGRVGLNQKRENKENLILVGLIRKYPHEPRPRDA